VRAGAVGSQSQRDPRHRGASEGEGEEQRRIQDRAQGRADERCAPPASRAQPLKHLDVEELTAQEGGSRRERDSWRCEPDRQHDRHRESGDDHPACPDRPMQAGGEIRDQETERIGDRAPGQDVVDRELHQPVRGQDDHDHGGERKDQQQALSKAGRGPMPARPGYVKPQGGKSRPRPPAVAESRAWGDRRGIGRDRRRVPPRLLKVLVSSPISSPLVASTTVSGWRLRKVLASVSGSIVGRILAPARRVC
jgi:hypothetical protein